MGGLGDVFAIDLEEEAGRNTSSPSAFPASRSVPTGTGDPEKNRGTFKTQFHRFPRRRGNSNHPSLVDLNVGSDRVHARAPMFFTKVRNMTLT